MDTLIFLACSDCSTPCEVKFCLLTSGNRVVYLTTCTRCNDHVSVRCFKVIDHIDWLEAAVHNLPVIAYRSAQ